MTARFELETLRKGAYNNPDHAIVVDVPAGRLSVTYKPVRDPVTTRIDKKATKDAILSLLFVYELEHDGMTSCLMRECDVLALMDGEPWETVKARRDADVGDVFEMVQAGLPLWARGG